MTPSFTLMYLQADFKSNSCPSKELHQTFNCQLLGQLTPITLLSWQVGLSKCQILLRSSAIIPAYCIQLHEFTYNYNFLNHSDEGCSCPSTEQRVLDLVLVYINTEIYSYAFLCVYNNSIYLSNFPELSFRLILTASTLMLLLCFTLVFIPFL